MSARALALALALALAGEEAAHAGAAPSAPAAFHRTAKAQWQLAGRFKVMLWAGSGVAEVRSLVRWLQAARFPQVLRMPVVEYIEEDAYVFAQSIPWNVGRVTLLQPCSDVYSPPNKGDRAEMYLLDTGVQSTHWEIKGRVLVTKFTSIPEDDGTCFHKLAGKCDSHGTHMAGVLSGYDAGVATGAKIHSLRVLNCQGKGIVSGTLMGLEFVETTLKAQLSAPTMVLLPFTSTQSYVLKAACRRMVQMGVVVVVAAAGNYKDDACLYLPASEPEVTVSCDDGWMLMGCRAHPQTPGTMGAYTVGDTCVAAGVPGSAVATAIAVCCRSWQQRRAGDAVALGWHSRAALLGYCVAALVPSWG